MKGGALLPLNIERKIMKFFLFTTILLIMFYGCKDKLEIGKTNYELAQLYSQNKEFYDYNKSILFYEKAIKEGEWKAYYDLGMLYGSSIHFYPRNFYKTKLYFEKAKENGDERANLMLGIIEAKGLVGEKNEDKALKYFNSSNNIEWQTRLYVSKDSKYLNYKKALELSMENSKKEGNYLSNILGYLYENGYGIKKDIDKANEFYARTSKYLGFNTKDIIYPYLETKKSNRYLLLIKAKLNGKGNLELISNLPSNIKGIQQIYSIKYSHKPYKILDSNGFKTAYFKIKKPNDYIYIKVDIELFNYDYKLKSFNSFVNTINDINETNFVESKNKKIIELSKKMKRDTEVDTLANLAYYSSHSLTYLERVKEVSATRALEEKVGDCSEYSNIFASLSRSLAFPTKIISGIKTNKAIHSWNVVYTKSYGWITYDIANNTSSFSEKSINDNIIFSENEELVFFKPYKNRYGTKIDTDIDIYQLK